MDLDGRPFEPRDPAMDRCFERWIVRHTSKTDVHERTHTGRRTAAAMPLPRRRHDQRCLRMSGRTEGAVPGRHGRRGRPCRFCPPSFAACNGCATLGPLPRAVRMERAVQHSPRMTLTIGQLVSTLFDAYDRELNDERLAAVATQVRIVELM